jgi:predicted DNA-binding protein
MKITLTDATEQQIKVLSEETGKSPEEIIAEAIKRLHEKNITEK